MIAETGLPGQEREVRRGTWIKNHKARRESSCIGVIVARKLTSPYLRNAKGLGCFPNPVSEDKEPGQIRMDGRWRDRNGDVS